MAQNKTVVLVDDLDGSEDSGVKKRKFGLDGVSYEIDLGDDNYARLRDIFADYIEAGRRVPRKRKVARNKPKRELSF